MITQSGEHYLYRHIRLDTGQPFYIGIGKKRSDIKFTKIRAEYRRAYDKGRRSDIWKNIVGKTNYKVEILLESDDYEFIKQKEIEFITLYGRRDIDTGVLCNLSPGGDINPNQGKTGEKSAHYGKTHTKETKDKWSLDRKGLHSGGKNPASRVIINVKTLKEKSCSKEGAEETGVNYSTFCMMLKFKKFNTTNYMYKEDYEKGYKLNQFLDKNIYKPIINIKTEELYTNTSKPSKILGISGRTLLSYLNNQKPNLTGYIFYEDWLREKR